MRVARFAVAKFWEVLHMWSWCDKHPLWQKRRGSLAILDTPHPTDVGSCLPQRTTIIGAHNGKLKWTWGQGVGELFYSSIQEYISS